MANNEIVVELTRTIEYVGNRTDRIPAELQKIPKTFRLQSGETQKDYQEKYLPKYEGQEKITVLGKEYQASYYKKSMSTEAGPIQATFWESKEMPGGFLKFEGVIEKVNSHRVKEVIALEIPS